MYKEHLKLNNEKMNNMILKRWAKDLKIYFTKEDIQMADKHMKKCSPSYVSRGLEIKAIMRYQHIYLSGQNPKH